MAVKAKAIDIRTEQGRYMQITGNYAAAYGAKLARPDVVTAYPITPMSSIIEKLSQFVESGEMKSRYIIMDSEHSVMAALIGACETGARTFTATSAQGLAYMHEMMHWSGRGRMPIVMAVVNRTLGSPSQLGAEQDDILSDFNTGWMMLFCEYNQEILDSVLLAYKIGEQVGLPVAVVLEGFTTSHTTEPVLVPKQELVDRFLPVKRTVRYKLDPADPHNFVTCPEMSGPGLMSTFRQRRRIQDAFDLAKPVAKMAFDEFYRIFGRRYNTIECVNTDDADVIIVTTQTMASSARIAMNQARKDGKKVGLAKILMYRPFPTEDLYAAVNKAKKLAVIDRNVAFGHAGVFALEVKAAMYNHEKRPPVYGFISGLSGTPVTPKIVHEMLDYCYQHDMPEGDQIWKGLEPAK
ncbi:MAG: pyruvate ferredoxin oxidoreductase [Chloroflexota bacterium]